MYDAGTPKPGLYDNLRGWDGEGDGKGVQEGGDICIPNADSCWCMVITITILWSNYPVVKKNIPQQNYN